MSNKLTPWFPGDVKPARPGVYERKPTAWTEKFSRWDGKKWCSSCTTARAAAKAVGSSVSQHSKWRGLAEKPEGTDHEA